MAAYRRLYGFSWLTAQDRDQLRNPCVLLWPVGLLLPLRIIEAVHYRLMLGLFLILTSACHRSADTGADDYGSGIHNDGGPDIASSRRRTNGKKERRN